MIALKKQATLRHNSPVDAYRWRPEVVTPSGGNATVYNALIDGIAFIKAHNWGEESLAVRREMMRAAELVNKWIEAEDTHDCGMGAKGE